MLASVAVASVRDLPQITAARAEAQAPPTAFGVFVTITRRRAGRREVHGCIGSYKTNGDSMPASDVVAKTMDAARSAAFDDERGARFEGPLRRDPSARVSTSVMKLPLVPLAFQDGRGGAGGEEAFDNGRTGVLVVGADGSTATFLPKVFPSSRPWTDIRTDLLAKANLSAGRSGKAVLSLYSYETLEVKAPLSRPYAGAYGDAVVSRYAAFVSGAGAFRNGLPPFRVSKEGVVGYDASEQIRNGAVCATLAKLTLPGNVARDVSAYLGALAAANPATTTLQAVAVAGVLPRERCAELLRRLPGAEPDFELPQLLHAYHQTCGDGVGGVAGATGALLPLPEAYKGQVRALVARVPSSTRPDDLFFLNHAVKVAFQRPRPGAGVRAALAFLTCSAPLSRATETNLLAVAFESGCFLLQAASLSPQLSHALGVRTSHVFALLMRRYDARLGLFAFLGGVNRSSRDYDSGVRWNSGSVGSTESSRYGDYRVDITDHVVHGLLCCSCAA
jgi:AMMECR1 domain-containing protein